MANINGGGNPPTSDQTQRDLSISLAASSMINASDMITVEEFEANQKRIQEVKEMVNKLEMNNEAAHKNFLVDQLQKRAQEGRKAEEILARLRNQPRLPQTAQFTNNPPGDRPEVVLPTTATLVEVAEPHPPQTVQQQSSRPQIQLDSRLRYYMPPQHSAAPYVQTPVDQGQLYTPQNQPQQSRVQTGFQVQRPQYWSVHPPPVVALPTTAVSGHYTSPAVWTGAPLAHGGTSGHPSSFVYREQGTSRPPAVSHNQAPNFASRGQGVPPTPVLPVPPTGSHSKPVESESQSRSVPTTVSLPMATPEFYQHPRLPQPQQHEQQFRSQPLPPPQPQQQQGQQLPQLPLQSQQYPQQVQVQHVSQRPSLPSREHQRAPPPPADRPPSTSAPPPNNQPSQSSHPTNVQEQARHQGTQLQDQATFIKNFQDAVRHGMSSLQTFCSQAKASGISDDWLKMGMNSVPRDVWRAVFNPSGSTGSAPQQQATIPRPDVPSVNAPPSLTSTPVVQMSAIEQTTKTGNSTEENNTDSAPKQPSGQYAVALHYYAEQATKSVLSAQRAKVSKMPPGNVAPTQTTPVTPQRDVPQIQASARTPKDANKSTLARDVLRALGKSLEKPRQETGSEPVDKISNREDGQLPLVGPPQPISRPVSPKPPEVSPATRSVDADSLLIPSASKSLQDVPQCAAPPCQLTEKMAMKEEHRQAAVIEGPIMIDLTLDDSDESVRGEGGKLNFPVRSSASAQPTSPTNTTTHIPLLENLSLEEAPVEVAGARDSTDVRMHSPHLSLAVEKDMEPEHLDIPLGNPEPVSLGFELLSSEPKEQPSGNQLPLFLPSPSVSPAPTERATTDPGMTIDVGEKWPSLKRHSVEVDKMDIDMETASLPRVRKRRKNRAYVSIPPAPLYVKMVKMKERAVVARMESELEGGGDEEPQYSHLERLLIEESKLRLSERRCRWLNCGAILNCGANLLAHLENHAREGTSQTPFICRWTGCQRQIGTEQERDIHLERHATRPLPCPFAGCNKQFDRPVEVMQHEVQHQNAEHGELLKHKPTCQPIVPGIPARLGPPPQWLPSHRVIARRVAKCQISADRHAIVGPWVLWNIFSQVDLHMRKQNASMRSRPTRQATHEEMDARRDDYDFLLALSSYPVKSAQLDDLDSTLITMSAARGLTLWGAPLDEETAVEGMCSSPTLI